MPPTTRFMVWWTPYYSLNHWSGRKVYARPTRCLTRQVIGALYIRPFAMSVCGAPAWQLTETQACRRQQQRPRGGRYGEKHYRSSRQAPRYESGAIETIKE